MDKLKINIPEGKEIDVEKSNLEKGEIYFKDKEKTLEDLIEEWYNISLGNVKWNLLIDDVDSCKIKALIAKILYGTLIRYFNYKRELNITRTFKIFYDRRGDKFFIKENCSNSLWLQDGKYIYTLSDAIKMLKVVEDNKEIFKYVFI